MSKNDPVKFHVLPEKSDSLMDAIESVEVDAYVVKDLLDQFLKGAVEERFAMFKMDERIQQQMERRIEIATKTIMQRMETELTTVLSQQVRERVKQIVAAMPVNVQVTFGKQEAP